MRVYTLQFWMHEIYIGVSFFSPRERNGVGERKLNEIYRVVVLHIYIAGRIPGTERAEMIV